MAKLCSDKLISIICLIFLFKSVKSEIFENVTIVLAQHPGEAFVNTVVVPFSNTIKEYITYSENISVVKIEKQHISLLNENSVSDLLLIKVIHINECGIKSIKPGAFKNIPNLDILDLNNNLLEEVQNGVFNTLNIKTLLLNKNRIFKIEPRAFNNMKMWVINLSDNRISSWNGDWFKGTPIRMISFSYNLIEEIPLNALASVKSKAENAPLLIISFNLSNNKVKKIHPGAFNEVQEINGLLMADNNISEVDVEGVFVNTTFGVVDLRNNSFRCFPMEIVDITYVRKLKLQGNPLTCDCVNNWKTSEDIKGLFDSSELSVIEQKCI